MIILGIDPGTDRAGYGVISSEGSALKLLEAGILRTEKAKGADALFAIKRELDSLIKKYSPKCLATEKLFFAANRTTGISIAEARGVILLAAREQNLKIMEFSPTEVKMGIAGYGKADKSAVLKMVKMVLRTPELKIIDDAADALAMAIVAAGQLKGVK